MFRKILIITRRQFSGKSTDKYGNLAEWWTEDVIATYLKRAECFVDQYSKFIVPFMGDTNQTTTVKINIDSDIISFRHSID